MNVLIFAPHNDDEVLGAGGTMRKHVLQGDTVYVCEITSGAHYRTLQEEARNAHELLGVKKTWFLNLPVGKLRNLEQAEINARIGEVLAKVKPEIVYLPFIGDMHLDHRETLESALVGLRPIHNSVVKEIYMYETLSETGWNLPQPDRAFIPTVWVDISETFDYKINAMKCFESQMCEYPHPRSVEGIEALAKYRGSTIGVPYAESFMAVRIIK